MTYLKLAVQKSGRLKEGSLSLLEKCGIRVSNGRDALKVKADNFPLEIFYLRNSDMPRYLQDGVVDIAVIGENLLVEKQSDVKILKRLGFSKCRLSIAVPSGFEYKGLSDLNNKRIATSYPNTLKTYLDSNSINCQIHTISGSVEIAPNIGLSDAVCDLVSSGNTLFTNGLKECELVLKSEAVLAANAELAEWKLKALDKLMFRMDTILNSRKRKYVLMNVPNEKIQSVSKILPVLKSPTVMPLAEPGWSSLHSVIEEDRFWDIIDELKNEGAEGILIAPIDKIVL